jgi:hypothetical protein
VFFIKVWFVGMLPRKTLSVAAQHSTRALASHIVWQRLVKMKTYFSQLESMYLKTAWNLPRHKTE